MDLDFQNLNPIISGFYVIVVVKYRFVSGLTKFIFIDSVPIQVQGFMKMLRLGAVHHYQFFCGSGSNHDGQGSLSIRFGLENNHKIKLILCRFFVLLLLHVTIIFIFVALFLCFLAYL